MIFKIEFLHKILLGFVHIDRAARTPDGPHTARCGPAPPPARPRCLARASDMTRIPDEVRIAYPSDVVSHLQSIRPASTHAPSLPQPLFFLKGPAQQPAIIA